MRDFTKKLAILDSLFRFLLIEKISLLSEFTQEVYRARKYIS
jgi:hypothetical protein